MHQDKETLTKYPHKAQTWNWMILNRYNWKVILENRNKHRVRQISIKVIICHLKNERGSMKLMKNRRIQILAKFSLPHLIYAQIMSRLRNSTIPESISLQSHILKIIIRKSKKLRKLQIPHSRLRDNGKANSLKNLKNSFKI